ncbi:MAG: ABC transporter permease [Clostridiales Family XIII bacterium]|nr:ABC transporter permease [Clostridiales Family XIII bacterium]
MSIIKDVKAADGRAAAAAIWEQVRGIPAILCFVVFGAIALIFVPGFSNSENIFNIITQSSDLIILSCGMTFVFINGSIDFSTTAVLALSSVIGAKVMTAGEGGAYVALGMLAMLGVGAGVGLLNGISVSVFRMPSFIATMATQLIFAGIALTMTESKSIGGIPTAFNNVAQGEILYVPIPIIITAVIVIASIFVLHFSVYGKRLFAVGVRQIAAYISGINVNRMVLSIFVISGFLSAIASIVMTARLGAGLPALGKDMLMDIVAAVVVGGTKVTGGKGTIVGTIIAAIFVVMLNNCLNLLGIEWFIINVCKGLLIIVVAVYSVIQTSGRDMPNA